MAQDAPPSELLLAEACEALQDAVYVKDLEGRYLMANPAAAAILGLSREELVGKTDEELFPERWEAVREVDQEVIESGSSQTLEEPVFVDGQLRTYLSTKAPLREGSGEIFGLIGISSDISRRKEAEEELRQGRAKLAEAQAAAQVGSWEWDLVRNEASWSEQLYRMFGVDPDAFEPSWENFLAAVHPDDREGVGRALDQSREEGRDYEIEYRIVRPDGEIRTIFARAQVFRDVDEAPVRMVGAGVDVTERKRSQERLEAGEALLRVAEELTEVGSFEWDVEADRVSWSDGLYRIFGFEPGEFPGTFEAYLERVHPDEREARRRAIEQVLRTGGSSSGVHRIVRPDDEVRWVESRIRVLKDDQGQVTELVGACQDVTERKLVEQGLEQEMEGVRARALQDPLTGLANRTLAFDRLGHAFLLAQRRDADLAVLFVDIDGFKRINDLHGHAAGDAALTSAAERLESCVRGSDTVARIGGDEFLVVCEESEGPLQAVETAKRLRDAFATPFDLKGHQELLGLSIGVSSIAKRQLFNARQLVEEADLAMYDAKRRGRPYAVFRPSD